MDKPRRSSPRRHVLAALRAVDAAIEVATREQDRTLKLALLEARGPPAAYLLLEQGVPRASEVRLRRAMSTR